MSVTLSLLADDQGRILATVGGQMLAALSVVWPGEYYVPDNRPDLEAQTFRALYDRKRNALNVALVAFGTSLIAFGVMVGIMLLMRYNG